MEYFEDQVDDRNFLMTDRMDRLTSALQRIEQTFVNKWEQILNPENFDFIYLMIKYSSRLFFF